MGFLKSLYNFFFITPEKIGKEGEAQLASKFRSINFWGKRGKLLRNVYVPRKNDANVEIDLLYITKKGILVIESKNYSGYIFGSDTQRLWTKTLYAGEDWLGISMVESHRFYNPIWQNATHIAALEGFLGTNIKTFSLVVFSNRCELQNISVSSSEVYLCNFSSLRKAVRRIWKQSPDILTEEEVSSIYSKLFPLTEKDRAVRRQHAQKIETRFQSKEVCPLCKGKLVRRTAKTGKNAGRDFLGCSNYPSCKYTKNI